MISRLLQPLLSLHGWEAYALIGLLVFAEDAVMLGFVFPGETAAILGGVLASKGGVSLGGIVAVVVLCAIVGDSVGYAIGDRWGRQLLLLGPLRKRQKGIDSALDLLGRRGAIAVFVGRFSAFLRAVIPGLAGMSKMRYRIFLPANAAGGICWGILFVLLGYFVGQRVEKVSGIASDILLGLIVVAVVVLFVLHRRKEKREVEGPSEATTPERRPRRLIRWVSGGCVEDGAVPGTQAGQDAGELPRRVVALGVGVHPAHRAGIAAVEPVQAEARLVGAPLVVVDQRPVQVGAHGDPVGHRVGHRAQVLAHVARPVQPVGAGQRPPGAHPGRHPVLDHPQGEAGAQRRLGGTPGPQPGGVRRHVPQGAPEGPVTRAGGRAAARDTHGVAGHRVVPVEADRIEAPGPAPTPAPRRPRDAAPGAG